MQVTCRGSGSADNATADDAYVGRRYRHPQIIVCPAWLAASGLHWPGWLGMGPTSFHIFHSFHSVKLLCRYVSHVTSPWTGSVSVPQSEFLGNVCLSQITHKHTLKHTHRELTHRTHTHRHTHTFRYTHAPAHRNKHTHARTHARSPRTCAHPHSHSRIHGILPMAFRCYSPFLLFSRRKGLAAQPTLKCKP